MICTLFRTIIFVSENITGIMYCKQKQKYVDTRSNNVSTIDRPCFFYCSAKTEDLRTKAKRYDEVDMTQRHDEELGGDHMDNVSAHIRYV